MKENNKFKCPFCAITLPSKRGFKSHIVRNHINKLKIEDRAKYEITEKDSPLKNLPLDIIVSYFNEYEKRNTDKPNTAKKKVFNTFYNQITYVRPFNKDTDFNIFFNKVLPWRKDHPKVNNSRELCSVIFENEEEANKLYQMMLEKNPYFKHNGTLSPFSKKFKGYKGMSEKEIDEARNKVMWLDRNDRVPNQIGYWLRQGLSEEEAQKKVSEFQVKFSKEICIKKYGEEEGLKVFAERQRKWLNSYKKSNFSQVSQKLFWEIYSQIKNDYENIYFASLDPITKEKDKNGKNFEYIYPLNDSYVKLDFYIKDINCLIEFDGEYWHGEAAGNQERDRIRDETLQKTKINMIHVKERDYYNNPELVLENCLNFIKNCKKEITNLL